MDINEKSFSNSSLEEDDNNILHYDINNLYNNLLEDLNYINLNDSKSCIEEKKNEMSHNRENKTKNNINLNYKPKKRKTSEDSSESKTSKNKSIGKKKKKYPYH